MTPQTEKAVPKPGLSATINKKKVDSVVKEILRDGTPDYIKHPNDYKSWLDEQEKADKERSNAQSAAYQMEDQEELTDEKSSLINFKDVNRFVAELRRNGIVCKISQDPQSPQTCGLWAIRPSYERLGFQFVTSMQVPTMPEWGLLREEEHGVPNGEAAIGWRQVLTQLVMKKVATEQQVHEIFGEPASNRRSRRYRRTMHAIRNGRTPNVNGD